MNKPPGRGLTNITAFVQLKYGCRASMKLRKHFGVRPFIFVLPDSIASNATGVKSIWVWTVSREPVKVSRLVVPNHRLHFFDFSPTYRAVLGPVLVTLALFVFFPVLHFATVAAHALPVRVAIVFHTPDSDRVTCNEWANRRFGGTVLEYTLGNLMFCRFTQHTKPIHVRGLHPLLRSNSVDERIGMVVSHTLPRTRFCYISIHDFWNLRRKQPIGGGCSVGWRWARWYRAYWRVLLRLGGDFTMECGQSVHCFEIFTFGHFVLIVFDNAHQRFQFWVYSHISFVRSFVESLYLIYCKKNISIFFTTRVRGPTTRHPPPPAPAVAASR